MPEKYFATILKKVALNETDHMYLVDTVVAGDIEEETQLFVTTNGTQYKKFKNFAEPLEENYYFNVVETDNIEEHFEENITFDEAIAKYEQNCKEIIHYVGHTENGYIIIAIDKGPYIRTIDAIAEDENAFDEDEIIQLRGKAEAYNDIPDTKEEHEDRIIEAIKELVMNVTDGKFTPDELIDIRDRLTDEKEEIEAAILAVDVQQETFEIEYIK